MAYQPKSYRKFIATAATATLVATAVTPAAAASFTDVNDRYADAVNYLVANNITAGLTDTTFGVNDNIKRGDAAVWLAKALKLDTANAADQGFTDLNSRVEGAVNALKAAGYINGKTATTFAPNAEITRGEMALILSNAFDLEGDADVSFTDVNSRYAAAVEVLVANKITSGVSATKFGTSSAIKRGDFAIFLHKAATHVPAKAEVVSVSAINAKEVVVKFNKEVDVTTAETATNYVFSEITGSAIGANPTTAAVQADGKSVKLTLGTAITASTTFTTTVSGVKVKGSAYDYFPQFAVATTYKDTVKADIVDVTSITNGTAATALTVQFSEPVFNATFKVNGSVATNVSFAANGYSATISGLSLDVTKSHTVDALNVTDYANNVNSLVSKTFNVVRDVAAPNVSISTNSDNQLVLTFNKAMNPATVNGATIKVKDELLSDLVVTGFTPDATNKKFTVDLPAGLYTSKASRTLTVLLSDSLEDYLGNKLVTQFQAVTVTEDTTAPTITGVTYVKNPATGNVDKLVVNFSEGLAASAGLSTTGIKVISPNGVDVTTGFLAATSSAVAKGSTKVEIPVTAAVGSGKYTFYVSGGFATDIAQTPNSSVASTNVVDFGSAASGEFTIAQSAIGQAPSNTTNVITVNYGRAVKGGAQAGSATDVNNYTLNGAPLPQGTLITLDATYNTATITVPDETVSVTDSAAVLRISGVQDLTGKTINPFIGTTSVIDSKAPVLSTAVLNNNGTFTVGFDQALATAALQSDFAVSINGKAVAASEITFSAGVGADAGKYVFAVNGLVEDPDATPANGDEFLYINADGVAGYQAATDIKVTGATATAGVVDLRLPAITSVAVSTAAGPLTGADAAGNTLKVSVSKSVK